MNSSPASPHIVFAGGGTGGHLFPGLAVAETFRQIVPDARITFAGTGKEFERRHVTAAGYDYLELTCRPSPQRAREWLRFVAGSLAGLHDASRFLHAARPAAVVGLGGYASFAMARAAALWRVPLLLLEQNAVAGQATRRLAPHAQLICTAFDVRNQLQHACPLRVTGNPVRARFAAQVGFPATPGFPEAAGGRPRQLLVLGGSQGAATLNAGVPLALAHLGKTIRHWAIVHQAGEQHLAATQRRYRSLRVKARVVPFLDDLPEVLAQSDLVVSRAGGTTLAELAMTGVPALLTPYRFARDQHQLRNAGVFSQAGAARMLPPTDDPPFALQLAAALRELVSDTAALRSMSTAMLRLARPAAAWHIASMLRDLIASHAALRAA